MAAFDNDDRTRFDEFSELARSRRTSMIVDHEREVPLDVIAELCGLATWAPNHKKTWPWRFAVFTGDGRMRLGDTMADEMERIDYGDGVRRAKTRTKYVRTPATLAMGAGIQNLLLGATALGLASFWSTPAITQPPAVLDLCGFEPGDRLVGMIYLGWAAQDCPAPERPQLPITHIAT